MLIDRYIQSICATSGDGLYEGMDWLSSKIDSAVFLFLNIFEVSSRLKLIPLGIYFLRIISPWPLY